MKLILICGTSRSGSTLLDIVLSQGCAVFSVGELRHIWKRGFLKNQLCSCGEPFIKCHVWGEVAKKWQRSPGIDGLEYYSELAGRLDTRWRAATYALTNRAAPTKAIDKYRLILERLYRDVFAITDADYIVDSSKTAAHAYLAAGIESIEVNVVHLVRDPRAVAYSWQRTKPRPETVSRGGLQQFGTHHPAKVAVGWIGTNMVIEALRGHFSSYCRLKYEDLVENPNRTLEGLKAEWLSQIGGARNVTSEDIYTSRAGHLVSGNPLRFKGGEIIIRADEEWVSALPAWKKVVVGSICLPLMCRYDYRAW